MKRLEWIEVEPLTIETALELKIGDEVLYEAIDSNIVKSLKVIKEPMTHECFKYYIFVSVSAKNGSLNYIR